MIQKLSFPDAINLAMLREMESDPSVFAFGVDAQDHKRTFGSGKGLVEKFGERRFFGSPLSEAGATGIAIGAALSGLRPIHIHARADFVRLAMNQLANMASNKAYMSRGQLRVPLVVRAVIGRSWGQGPQHSKSMHSVFAHFPGLKVVLPGSPQDGYGLFRSAIRDDNPVIFLEHRWLYDVTGEVDDEDIAPLGRARVLRRGEDVTIVACSWMTVEAMQAARILAANGVEAEVVDVRTVAPLDTATIVASAGKTLTLMSGGAKRTDAELYDDVKVALEAGVTGFIFGRNMWQRRFGEALEVAGKITKMTQEIGSRPASAKAALV
jgi:pyruvate dehydrogenase E1 component beta subunit